MSEATNPLKRSGLEGMNRSSLQRNHASFQQMSEQRAYVLLWMHCSCKFQDGVQQGVCATVKAEKTGANV